MLDPARLVADADGTVTCAGLALFLLWVGAAGVLLGMLHLFQVWRRLSLGPAG